MVGLSRGGSPTLKAFQFTDLAIARRERDEVIRERDTLEHKFRASQALLCEARQYIKRIDEENADLRAERDNLAALMAQQPAIQADVVSELERQIAEYRVDAKALRAELDARPTAEDIGYRLSSARLVLRQASEQLR